MLLDQQIDQAVSLIQSGHYGKARAICTALSLRDDDHPVPPFLLGTISLKEGDPATACTYLALAVERDPGNAEYLKFLGDAYQTYGEFSKAAASFERAQELAPDRADILNSLAMSTNRLGRIDDACRTFEEAAAAAPDNATILVNLGNALKNAGRFDEAADAFRNAIRLDPSYDLAYLGLARLLREAGRLPDALEILSDLAARRGDLTFEVTRANWILPLVPKSLSEMQDARAAYEQAIEKLRSRTGAIDESMLLHAGTNFSAVYQGADDRPCQEIIADFYRRNCPSLSYVSPHLSERRPGRDRKLRIGFVSLNFSNHTVGKLFRGIIANLQRAKFEVVVFGRRSTDEIGQFVHENCDRFEYLPAELPAARRCIADARLDILFFADIGMDALTYFLAFARLAPVQCVGWGHGVTTGLDTVDYFVSHTFLQLPDPKDAQSRYSERLVNLSLPPSYLYPPAAPTAADRPDLSFADGKTLYCCPQALFKIHPEFDDLLVGVLSRDENGVAALIDGAPGQSDILRERWRAKDPTLDDRIFFLPRLGQSAFLTLVRATAVILDTIYACGGISSAEALSQATPIVTWPNSPLLFARVTDAYYREIGVTDCVANSAGEYIDIAVKLGTDPGYRAEISAKIAANNHRLFGRHEVIDELSAFFENAVAMHENQAAASR